MSEGGYPKPDRPKAMQNILVTGATGLISNASVAGPVSGLSRYENTFRLS
jgi:hypothetical protein